MAMLMSSQVYRPSQVAGTKNPTLWKMGTQPNKVDRIEFNLSTDDYLDLMRHIRSIVQNPGWYSHNRPVLSGRAREEVPPTPDWLDIALSTNTGQNITLRIRQDDLYLVGYQTRSTPTQCGQWLEFGTLGSSTQLIQGSTFLGFEGSYTALESAGRRPIEGHLMVSREQVIGAVNELASTLNPINRARDLALMIMVICEATRFEEISSMFANVMRSGSTSTVTIDGWMLILFRAWGDLSGRLLNADAYGERYFSLPTTSPLRQRIQSALDAVRYLALLLGPLKMNPRSGGLGASAKSGAGGIDVPRGQPMMEVLAIPISDYSGNISGTITVTDGLGTQTLFSGSQYVQSGGTLTVGLLNQAISAWESISVNAIFTTPCWSGSASWDIFQTKDDYTDDNNNGIRTLHLAKHPSKSKDATDLQVSMCRGIFREAWQIIWKVKIVNGDGYDQMNVYGSVNVSYSVGADNFSVKLFSRSSDYNVTVCVGGYVEPLLRKAMAVPLDVNVNVDVDLWDYIRVLPDRCIGKGRLTFWFGSSDAAKAMHEGSYALKLAGNNENSCGVQVCACWNRVSLD